jgi:hypothetical protein
MPTRSPGHPRPRAVAPIGVAGAARLALAASFALALSCVLATAPAAAQSEGAAPRPAGARAASGADIALYPGGPALVREALRFRLPDGEGRLTWDGPPSALDFSSLSLLFPDRASADVVEQRSLSGGADMGDLLRASVGRAVALVLARGDTLRATLVSASGGLLLKREDGSIVSLLPGQVRELLLPGLPEGLRLAPAVTWTVRSTRGGEATATARYLTGGLSWNAEYAITLAPSGKRLALEAWADLRDDAGRSWPGARVRLVAGQINRTGSPQALADAARAKAFEAAAPAPGAGQAEERSFSEYHVFELPDPVTLEDGQTVRALLLRAPDVPTRKLYLYDGDEGYGYGSSRPITQPQPGGSSGRTHVRAVLELASGERAPIDRALPAGRARIYEEDADGSTLLAGEAPVPDLMVGDTVRLPMGRAFDLTAERTRTDFRRPDAHSLEESYRIVLKSAKKEPVEVRVTERMFRWHEWSITAESVGGKPVQHARPDAEHAEWRVTVPAGGQAALEYTVRYSWSEQDLR